ncbi:hypothetical protein [Streptomyces sp. NPDC059701]|uniref:hypothetical protein n=1 Tax=Streptomyces sp. NPDC059701 TaxID=3346914 RepID=UPI0036B5C8D2
MTTRGTPGRMVRIEDDVWIAYGQLCEQEGTSRADDIRRHVHSRVNAWRAKDRKQRLRALADDAKANRVAPADSDD